MTSWLLSFLLTCSIRSNRQRLQKQLLQVHYLSGYLRYFVSSSNKIRPRLTKMAPASSYLKTILSNFDKTVKISDFPKTEEKLTKMINEGASSLQIISDFDLTITRVRNVEGDKCETSYGILANSSLVSSEFRKTAWDMYMKYNPIEIDPKLTIEEKTPHMVEWYEKSHEVLLTAEPKLKKSSLDVMVQNSKTALRDNCKEFILSLNSSNIPVLVFSAGLGNIVEEVLKHHGVDSDNVGVISNFIEFDDQGEALRFKDPLIHMFNKNEAALDQQHSKYFDDLKGRKNVILFGDSLGDANMDEGIPEPKCVLRIAFLNDNTPEHLESYMGKFDIVLVEDETFDLPNLILQHILESSSNKSS